MAEHARLSPSAAERWLSCPASVLEIEALPQEVEEQTNFYAEEGTICHALAEIRGRAHFGKITKAQAKKELAQWRKDNGIDLHTENEMWMHVDTWLAVLQEFYEEHPGSEIYFEQRLDTGVPSSWGTTDCAIVSPRHIYVIDYKYGQGIRVDAEENPQLRLYGLGVLDEHDIAGLIDYVTLAVVQPRIEDRQGGPHISVEKMMASDLYRWRDDITPIAESSLLPGAPYGPSDKACRWCPLSGKCRAQLEAIFAEVDDFEKDPAELTPAEMADILPVIPRIRDWVNAFEAQALHRALDNDEEIPGYKVVMSGGRRGCINEEQSLAILQDLGYGLDDVTTRKIVGIGMLEALIGKKEFTQHLGMWYPKSSGKPSLVPVEDKRPALNREAEAVSVFTAEVEDLL